MTREEILTAIRPYFDIDELVCNHTFAKWGEKAWQFLDTDYLHCLLVIRRDISRSCLITSDGFIVTWDFGFMHKTVITTAAKYQESVVGQATPAAPARRTKMPMAFPITFSRFIAPETYIVVRVRPMER